LKALLHIMAYGHYLGKDAEHPDIRNLFDRAEVIGSDWYHQRLVRKQQIDVEYFSKSADYLKQFIGQEINREYVDRLNLHDRLHEVEKRIAEVKSPEYLRFLTGTIGADFLL